MSTSCPSDIKLRPDMVASWEACRWGSVTGDASPRRGSDGADGSQYHPIDDIPFVFIHPCRTADALREVGTDLDVDLDSYLLLWLGLVGGRVGLSLSPKRGPDQLSTRPVSTSSECRGRKSSRAGSELKPVGRYIKER